MRTRILVGAAALGLTAVAGAVSVTPVAAAATTTQIVSPGPLTRIDLNTDLSCNALRAGDTQDEFFGINACGTWIAVAGTVYGPTVSAGGAVGATAFTPVSQTGVTGNGTAATPYSVTTVATGDEFTVTQTDTYVVGNEHWDTMVTLTNTAAAARTFHIYRGGDCYQANSDYGFGELRDGRHPACISEGGRIQQLTAVTPDNTWVEDFYSAVWSDIGAAGDLPNTINEGDEHDNGVAVAWDYTLPPDASTTVHSQWFTSSPFIAFAPQRIMDTRQIGETVDDLFEKTGPVPGTTTVALQVGGRAGVSGDASSAILNVAVTDTQGPGYLTLYPCSNASEPRPNASSVNYFAAQTRSVAVYAKLGPTGLLCIYSKAGTEVIVDVNGYQPESSQAFTTVTPARLLDTRNDGSNATVDGLYNAYGRQSAGSVIALDVAGRGNVPDNASAAILSVAGVHVDGPGYITVFPCDAPQRPTASNINFNLMGDVVPNAVISPLSADGYVCVFVSTGMDVIVDVNGYAPAGAQYHALTPARLMDTRAEGQTIDGEAAGDGMVGPTESGTSLQVTGRAGVPGGAVAAVINVTVVGPTGPGYVTVWPCGTPRPLSSNVNYLPGQTVANLVMAGLNTSGEVCLYSKADTHLVVDVAGYFGA